MAETRQIASKRPTLAVTMGDPAGIGPEITIRALMNPGIVEICNPVVVGDASVMEAVADGLGASVQICALSNIKDAASVPGTINILDLANVSLAHLKKGEIDAAARKAAAQYVFTAIDLALADKANGIVTAPIHKQALHLAGYNYPGHTEILAEKTGANHYAMMFVAGALRIILVTIHCSIREALDAITQDLVFEKIRMAHDVLKVMGFQEPRIAVAGINPHAGEGGLFGDEEAAILQPPIEAARREGIGVFGPYPPDTVFNRALKGQFDVVVCMYHDQGLIPVKLVGFDQGVNVTLGLPLSGLPQITEQHSTSRGGGRQIQRV